MWCTPSIGSVTHVYYTLIVLNPQVQYGLLMACAAKEHTWFCLVRVLEQVQLNSEPISNDYDCPLLTMTNSVLAIVPSMVRMAVSIVHECTDTCIFVRCQRTRRLEREDVSTNSLVFRHDLCNAMYCLNTYCINQ